MVLIDENSQSKSSIEQASDIEMSGRWSLFNQRITVLVTSFEEDSQWRFVLLANLADRVFYEFNKLRKSYMDPENDISLMAWRARNILELSIWSYYITRSEENAKKFEGDAARDALDIVGAYNKWGVKTAQDKDWIEKMKNTGEDIKQKAQSRNVHNLEKSYQRINKAAEELGIEDHYNIANKQLSKHAHPTAMHIQAPLNDKNAMQPLKELFYEEGCGFFVGAFGVLEEHLKLLISQVTTR